MIICDFKGLGIGYKANALMLLVPCGGLLFPHSPLALGNVRSNITVKVRGQKEILKWRWRR